MKYIEELECGDTFLYNNKYFVLSSDFKKNDTKMCVSLSDGFISWLRSDIIIEQVPLYRMDENNNIIAIKKSENKYVINQQNSNIY